MKSNQDENINWQLFSFGWQSYQIDESYFNAYYTKVNSWLGKKTLKNRLK
jgi:hypothetical protein